MRVLATVAVLGAAVVALYYGRDVLIPLALAILIAFVLAPAATRLRRLGLGNGGSVVAVVVAALIGVGAVGWVLAGQVVELIEQLPTYETNLRLKIRDLGATAGGGHLIERVTGLLGELEQELAVTTSDDDAAVTGEAAAPAAAQPMVVQVAEEPGRPLQTVVDVALSVLSALALPALVVIFVLFLLLQREDLRDRMIRLAGVHDVVRTSKVLTDAADRVSRYMLSQFAVNALFGVAFAGALFAIGVPNAVLWGVFGIGLRFIPFVGAPLAALFPLLISLAIEAGWTTPLLVVVAFVIIEGTISTVVEPVVCGVRMGLSPFPLLVATAFWTLLWGPIGLLLATPLTVCLVVLGRHVPYLQLFDVLLGTEPPLEAPVKFYQRLLVEDREGALEFAELEQERGAPLELFDNLVVPVLQQVEADRRRAALTPATRAAVLAEIRYIVGEVSEVPAPVNGEPPATRALCVGSRSASDDVAAVMLANMLAAAGQPATAIDHYATGVSALRAVFEGPTVLVAIAIIDVDNFVHVRRQVRRIRQAIGAGLPFVIVWLGAADPPEGADTMATPESPVSIARSLSAAVAEIQQQLSPPAKAEGDESTPSLAGAEPLADATAAA